MKLTAEEALQKALRLAEKSVTGEIFSHPLEVVHTIIEDTLKFYQSCRYLDEEVLYDLELRHNFDPKNPGGQEVFVKFLGTAPLGSTKKPKICTIGADWV